MDIREIAYHEAGHTVMGYLFYPPVSCTIVPSNGRLGNTISEIPPPFFGKFQNKQSSIDYLKIALYSWSGEYFQKIISPKIDEGGLANDKEILDFYCDNKKLYEALNKYKQEILNTFFEHNGIYHDMVNTVASNLLTQKLLSYEDVHLVLSQFEVNWEEKMNTFIEKFHDLICHELV